MTRRKKITIFAVGIALACGLAACSLLSACEPNSAEGGGNNYTPRSENYLDFYVGFGEDRAYYYWYAEYAADDFVVTVDIVDDYISLTAENIWNRDNIEFVVQQNTTTVGLEAGKSFNVMVNPKTLDGSARYAVSTSAFGASSYYALLETEELEVSGEERTKADDGYNGYTIEVKIDYGLLGEKDDLVGNVTIMPAARNTGKSVASYWRSYVGYGCRWNYANYAVRVQSDGSFCQNYFDFPDFESALVQYGAARDGKTLNGNMAEVQTEEEVRQFGEGANLFTDRTYLADPVGMPELLEDKSYIYAPIGADYDFTVTGAGYVLVTVPSTGYQSTADYFLGNGFIRIAADQPRIGYNNSGGTGIYELTDYFVKWCEPGETYHPQRYCLVFFGERAEYEKDFWVANGADVIVLNTPELVAKYAGDGRLWQGIPGIEAVPVSGGGTRLWATWFTGSTHEPSVGNYCLYAYSDDDGKSWTAAVAVAFGDGVDNARCYDPGLFYDGDGNLWLWWNQTNYSGGGKYGGVWCAQISNPLANAGDLQAGAARRICDGLKMNKPTILSTGEWAFFAHIFGRQGYTQMYVSADKGQTWQLRGEMYVPNALFANETAFAEVERDGKTVYMAINRTNDSYNLAVNYSYDGGYTWTDGVEWDILGPSSRPMLKTLSSGNVLYVHHYYTAERKMLSIWLSEDGGVSWPHCLIIDVRSGISYPDVTVDGEGNIYVVWDYDRYGAKSILMAKVSEAELLAIDGTATMAADRIVTVSAPGITGADMLSVERALASADVFVSRRRTRAQTLLR